MLVIVHRAGWTLKECPIVFRDRILGQSTLSGKILVDSLRIVLRFRAAYGSGRGVRARLAGASPEDRSSHGLG